jgi:hypothetical protein
MSTEQGTPAVDDPNAAGSAVDENSAPKMTAEEALKRMSASDERVSRILKHAGVQSDKEFFARDFSVPSANKAADEPGKASANPPANDSVTFDELEPSYPDDPYDGSAIQEWNRSHTEWVMRRSDHARRVQGESALLEDAVQALPEHLRSDDELADVSRHSIKALARKIAGGKPPAAGDFKAASERLVTAIAKAAKLSLEKPDDESKRRLANATPTPSGGMGTENGQNLEEAYATDPIRAGARRLQELKRGQGR